MSKQKRTRMNDEDAWSDNGLMQKRASVDETAIIFYEIDRLFRYDCSYPEQQTLSYVSQQDLTPKDLTDTPKDLTDMLCPVNAEAEPNIEFPQDEDRIPCLQLFPHGDSYPEPQNLSYVSQQDLAPEDLTDMPCPVNAEAEPNIEFPQGNEGRIDNIWSNDDQVREHIGKIVVYRRKIGKGSNGTIVYEGKYDGRLAAVKCLVRAFVDDNVFKEIDILIKSDRHENIVRYYGVEKSQHFVYLALELCNCSLDDLIQAHSDSSNYSVFPGDPASMDDNKIKLASVRSMMQKYSLWQADGRPTRLLLKLMRDMVLGLNHLHELRIIHRDLKPQNVLIAENQELVARLSDMGISRCLTEDKSSLEYPTTGCGTSGWRAPEVLRSGGRQTRAIDLFSLGCVLFFCITRGKHPFGDNMGVTLTFVTTKRTYLGWNSYQKLTI